MKCCHLAIDIGASSGRHIIGFLENGRIQLEEVYRFENLLINKNGHLCWDIDGLWNSVLEGIKECRKKGFEPETLGIDTWGVDFVLLDKEGNLLGDAVAYRDSRTDTIRAELEDREILDFNEHYSRCGIQYQKFNTVYQLLALKKENPELLNKAEKLLLIPNYLNYKLTGISVNEYTNATTTALVKADTKAWDEELIERLGIPKKIFCELASAGTVLGGFTEEIKNQVGCDIRVVLPATHDTGSAFLAVPARDDEAVFLSSGTWSLMGVENTVPVINDESMKLNFTNEGGFEYRYRYLKNIMGLWMIQSVRRELEKATGNPITFPYLIEEAKKFADITGIIDVDSPRFLAPESMIDEVRNMCKENGIDIPNEIGAVMQIIYNSLADAYRRTIVELSRLTGKNYTSVNIIGGGSRDMYLNQKTADAVGIPVFAGPTEGTALGNLIVQFIASGEFDSLETARKAVKTSFDIKEVTPQ